MPPRKVHFHKSLWLPFCVLQTCRSHVCFFHGFEASSKRKSDHFHKSVLALKLLPNKTKTMSLFTSPPFSPFKVVSTSCGHGRMRPSLLECSELWAELRTTLTHDASTHATQKLVNACTHTSLHLHGHAAICLCCDTETPLITCRRVLLLSLLFLCSAHASHIFAAVSNLSVLCAHLSSLSVVDMPSSF